MLKRMVNRRMTILVLALLLSVASIAVADYWAYGNPCHAERLLYYSDASHTSHVGGDEIICGLGRHRWGQITDYAVYQYQGSCCNTCQAGSCAIDP